MGRLDQDDACEHTCAPTEGDDISLVRDEAAHDRYDAEQTDHGKDNDDCTRGSAGDGDRLRRRDRYPIDQPHETDLVDHNVRKGVLVDGLQHNVNAVRPRGGHQR
ncbi:MAG TPA: hypothetical protein VNS19_04690 [Acidimicrobiales bacterium]|nr:hypothetical protein [Acidimicrobiales bacterium]